MMDVHKTTYIVPGNYLNQDKLHHQLHADELRIKVVHSKRFGTYIEQAIVILMMDGDETSITTTHSLESVESTLCSEITEANQKVIVSALMDKLNMDWYVNTHEQGEADYILTEALVNRLVKYE